MLAHAFADLAGSISASLGGPYHPATLHQATAPVFDDGGSIVTPGMPIALPCQCQVDAATQAMRQADGFVDVDVRLLILTATLAGIVSVGQTVDVSAGPRAGSYTILSVDRDPLGFAFECRGRRV